MTRLDRGRRRIAIVCVGLAAVGLGSAVAADAASDAARNLIVNGGAERGESSANGYDVVADIPGWTRSGKFTVVAYGAPDFPTVEMGAALAGGANFFAGGPANAGSGLTQDIHVSATKRLIDSGKAKATLSGRLGGYATQNDSLVGTAIFLSQSGARLGAIKIGPVGATARESATKMIKQTATGAVPKKTRIIRVTLRASRTSGAYNDGYADNLSLTLGK